jgi:hypothetical protein
MERLHADHAVFNGITYLIIYDSLSKWLEIYRVESTNFKTTARAFNKFFHTHGFCDTLNNDNGPPFSFSDFATYCTKLGMKHVLSPPWHPPSNGIAERAVQTFKHFLKLRVEHKDMTQAQLEEKISEYLFTYRNTPSTVTGKTPSQLFLNCEPKTLLSNLRPPEQKLVTPGTKPKKEFISNEDVFVQTHSNKIINWFPGTIVKQLRPYVYRVLVNDVYRNCHINQLRRMSADCSGPFELNVSRTPGKVVLGSPRAVWVHLEWCLLILDLLDWINQHQRKWSRRRSVFLRRQ